MKRVSAVLVVLLVACSTEVGLSMSGTVVTETDGPAPAVTFTAMPKSMQVYPRELKSNQAVVQISGAVATPGYKAIIVRVKKDEDSKPETYKQKLKYENGEARFTLSPRIIAELKDNEFSVNLLRGRKETAVAKVAGVVGGDIILINGQSNAEARGFNGSANGNQRPFLRSFGTRLHDPRAAQDLEWRVAEGDRADGDAAVGQWGLRLGSLIVDTYKVPVAIVNGAIGGRPIGHYQPQPNDRGNLNTNYGRLLFRCRQAGVAQAARAMFWYQGESDQGAADAHEQGFVALYEAWKEDYPALEKIYVMQLRVGCGVDRWNVELRDRQRLLPDTFSDIVIMSSNGINSHNGCHYAYDGYKEIGERLFRLAARDLYGAETEPGVDAPNVARAELSGTDHSEIILTTRDTVDLRFQSGAEADFQLEGVDGVTVTGGTTSGNQIILKLSGDGSKATGVRYVGHAGSGPWVINRKGIGLLSFRAPLQ